MGYVSLRPPKMMQKRFLSSVFALAFIGAATTGQAQVYKFHGADIGVDATGQYTTSITSQTDSTNGTPLPHQGTTDSPGVLVTLRDHPVAWAGVEVNYQYTKFDERFVSGTQPTSLTTNMHEATAAYLFHPHMRRLSPYVGIGGGALDFIPVEHLTSQWRGTGLVDVGLDMQTHSRLGFRIGARDLIYRAPNYGQSQLASSRWVSTEEPYGGVYIKF